MRPKFSDAKDQNNRIQYSSKRPQIKDLYLHSDLNWNSHIRILPNKIMVNMMQLIELLAIGGLFVNETLNTAVEFVKVLAQMTIGDHALHPSNRCEPAATGDGCDFV